MSAIIATEEHSFNKLKIIKTYLWSKISQNRLTNSKILIVKNKISNNINFECVIEDKSIQGRLNFESYNIMLNNQI